MSTKKLKEYMKNPPLVKVGGATLIDFGKIIKEELKDPEFRKGFEIERKKLEMSLAIINLRKKKSSKKANRSKSPGQSFSFPSPQMITEGWLKC